MSRQPENHIMVSILIFYIHFENYHFIQVFTNVTYLYESYKINK